MNIIRFSDPEGVIHFGCDYDGVTANLLRGNPLREIAFSGQRAQVANLLAPVEPTVIVCIGLNYRQHAAEMGMPIPPYPVLFMKNTGSVNHPNAPIVVPACCRQGPELDYEVELAVVIGRTARNVGASKALDYVFGYTVANDVTARRWQKHAGGGQWVRGKSFDTFCPLGPVLVTADAISDPQNLRLRCAVNGELRQDSSTADMIFSVAQLIEYLTEDTTLATGTVILTGTPSGVGFMRHPPVYLNSGDVVELTIDGVGTLRNTVQ